MTQTAPNRPPQSAGLGQAFRSLRHANFRWYWFSGIGMAGAEFMRMFSVLWLVQDLTDSVTQIGLVTFAQGAPMTIVALFGGVLADRYNRRALLIASQSVSVSGLFLLAVLTLTDVVVLWQVYAISFMLGATQALMAPARQAMIAALVPREELTNAVALNTMQQLASRMVWPLLAAGLISASGVGSAFLANAGCFVLAAALLLLVRGVHSEPPRERMSPIKEIIEGLNYTRATPEVRIVVGLTWIFGMFGLAFVQMAPALARTGFGFGAFETGAFVACLGLGAAVGSTAMSVMRQSTSGHFVLGTSVFAFTLILFAITPWTPLVFPIAFVNGMFNTVQVIASNAIFQQMVPSRFLGRVISLWFLAAGLAAISALPIGIIGDLVDLPFGFACAGAVYLVFALWFGVLGPRLRRDRPHVTSTTAPGVES